MVKSTVRRKMQIHPNNLFVILASKLEGIVYGREMDSHDGILHLEEGAKAD